MAEGKSKWGFPIGLAVVVLIMIAASLIFQQQQIDQTAVSAGAPSRNTIYVNRQGEVVAADTTFQTCQRQCASICDPEYPNISSCLDLQSSCTYRCVEDRR